MPSWLLAIIPAIAAILVPIVSVPLNQLILNLNTWVNARPAWVKQIVVGIITTLLTLAAQHAPGVPTSLQGFDVTVIGGLLNSGIAFLLHLAQSPAAQAPAGAVITAAAVPKK